METAVLLRCMHRWGDFIVAVHRGGAAPPTQFSTDTRARGSRRREKEKVGEDYGGDSYMYDCGEAICSSAGPASYEGPLT